MIFLHKHVFHQLLQIFTWRFLRQNGGDIPYFSFAGEVTHPCGTDSEFGQTQQFHRFPRCQLGWIFLMAELGSKKLLTSQRGFQKRKHINVCI